MTSLGAGYRGRCVPLISNNLESSWLAILEGWLLRRSSHQLTKRVRWGAGCVASTRKGVCRTVSSRHASIKGSNHGHGTWSRKTVMLRQKAAPAKAYTNIRKWPSFPSALESWSRPSASSSVTPEFGMVRVSQLNVTARSDVYMPPSHFPRRNN